MWTEDVTAAVETCRRVGVPAAVERSRSGNGAHVWFFFTAPVAASTARKMGCYLITETMARRHQLSMDSYDRLFPSVRGRMRRRAKRRHLRAAGPTGRQSRTTCGRHKSGEACIRRETASGSSPSLRWQAPRFALGSLVEAHVSFFWSCFTTASNCGILFRTISQSVSSSMAK